MRSSASISFYIAFSVAARLDSTEVHPARPPALGADGMMVGTRAGASVTLALPEAICRAPPEPGVFSGREDDTPPVVTPVWGTGAWVASAICLIAELGGEANTPVPNGDPAAMTSRKAS